MVEIALSLAIIGFALVAIIGVLPIGLNVQRENREETIINQDAAVFINAIRYGARGLDDLTNNVIAITNYITRFDVNTNVVGVQTYSFTYQNWSIDGVIQPPADEITNGYRIIGLMSTPKYVFDSGGFNSNYVVAYVRAISGLAAEKYPQDNPDVRQDAFSYRLVLEVSPYSWFDRTSTDPGSTNYTAAGLPPEVAAERLKNWTDWLVAKNLEGNLHELRMLFRWPVLPSSKIGNGRQLFRTVVGGQLIRTNDTGLTLFFFEPQTFGTAL